MNQAELVDKIGRITEGLYRWSVNIVDQSITGTGTAPLLTSSEANRELLDLITEEQVKVLEDLPRLKISFTEREGAREAFEKVKELSRIQAYGIINPEGETKEVITEYTISAKTLNRLIEELEEGK